VSLQIRPTRACLEIDELVGGHRRTREGELRRIVLVEDIVDYRLVRAKRRSIGMQVGAEGLTVRASRWVSIRDVEAALHENAEWIRRRLAEWRAVRRDVFPGEWKSGATIVVQGRELELAIAPARRKDIAADLINLVVRHPSPHDERALAAFVVRWLRDEALRLFTPRLAACAARIAARSPPLKLSNARSEWGSCNRKGEIRLNWRLIQLPPELAQYVVAHEVAHLVELNHSPRFWALVELLHPGHASARRALSEWSMLLG
jgi:predicted metal-dependent hydrolase